MPVLSPDLVAPSAAVADTIASPAVTVASLSAPGSPTGLVAVPGNARVSLTWSAPLSNGGARISDYVVQYSSDTGTTWTTFADRVSAATSATVTGLTNGASYLFRVAAVNAAGTGDPSARSASFVPATFGGFSELSAPEQMATGTAVPISGRVFDPTGTAVDAIHVYRDADGNGDLDPGIDQLLHVDTTPGSGFEFDTSTLASGVHRIIVAATNAGSVVGSTPLTVTASDWWEMSIGPRTHGEAGFTASGELSTGLPQGVGKPVYVAPGTNINDAWIAAVKEHVSGTIGISNHDWLDPYAYTFGPGAFRVGVRGALATEVANDPRATDTFDINLPDDTKLIVLEDLSAAADLDNDFDYDDQYWVVTWSPLLVDLDVTPREVDEDGSQGLVYTFTRSVATASALTVGYAVDGTATAGNDYTGLPLGAGVKTITIPANQRTASVTVFPTPDSEIEPDETVVITLQNGTGYAVGAKSIATGTITTDDYLVDLDIDSNNDGQIDLDNAAASTDDPIEEQSPGRILFVNSDDDDRNGVADVFDIGSVAGENDLVAIVVSAAPLVGVSVGSLIVTYDEMVVRLYKRPDRSGGIVSGASIPADAPLYAEGRIAGTSLVTVTWTVGGQRASDTIRLTVQPYPATIDVDVDSDNNNAFGPPDRSEWEDTLENHEYAIGKLIMLDNPQRTVTPIWLQLPTDLPANAGNVRVRIDWNDEGPAGSVRLWNRAVIDDLRNPAPVDQGGNQLFPGRAYKLAALNYDATNGRIVIYAEGITENVALKTLAGIEAAPKVDERIRGTLV
ncbi:MAG: Extracellular phospholipase precursor, partial [Planctomycetota bacterium]